MQETLSHHVIENYYLGHIISNLARLPSLVRRLKIDDPHNTKYSLRFLTLKDETVLLYLDYVSTNRLCKNIHHIDILAAYQASHSSATPLDAGYLEFDHSSPDPVAYLSKTANSLVHYQLGHDGQLRQKSLDLLAPHLSKIGYRCQNIPFASKPDVPQPEYYD